MKPTLLLTLLLAGTAWGQQDICSPKIFASHFLKIVGDTTHEELITAQDLVYAWKKYKAECWADSTLRCFGVYENTDGSESFVPCDQLGIDPGFDSRFRGTREKWIHRTPTAEDFLDRWLSERIKQ